MTTVEELINELKKWLPTSPILIYTPIGDEFEISDIWFDRAANYDEGCVVLDTKEWEPKEGES